MRRREPGPLAEAFAKYIALVDEETGSALPVKQREADELLFFFGALAAMRIFRDAAAKNDPRPVARMMRELSRAVARSQVERWHA